VSFILDALRKSESQRRLEAVPEVMRVPIAVQRDRLPPWAVAVMATLALALAATAVVGWRSQQTRTGTPGVVTPRAETSVAPGSGATRFEVARDIDAAPEATADIESAAARDVGAAPPPEAEPRASAPARDTERAATRRIAPESSAANVAQLQAEEASAPVPIDEPAPIAVPAPIDVTALPSVAALQAAGVAIPELDLQLLVTSSTPASRLVVINGRRYREGERLVEGSEVIEIIEQGAVMRHAGRDFLLVPD